jgi:hypothetical protein
VASIGNNPLVELVEQSRDAEVTTTTVRLRGRTRPAHPVARAGLWPVRENAERAAYDLHKLVGSDDVAACLTFESYEERAPLLERGSVFVLQPWWTPDAFTAATDTDLRWQRARFSEGDHEHCLLTWKTIAPGEDAYRSDAGWISEEAYARFIADDRLRLRA